MGENSEGIATNSSGSESYKLGSCEAHDVSSSPQETFGVSESEMAED
jgi:hypothetical protein